MKKDYNSRQNKIYDDYKESSPGKLQEIIKNRNRYLPEVIDIIMDILEERKDIPVFIKKDIIAELAKETEAQEKQKKKEIEDQIPKERKKRQEDVNKFLPKSEKYSDKELSEVITRYLYYEPAAVEAALIISERRRIISSVEKKNLIQQIDAGFSKKLKQDKRVKKTRKKFSRIEIISGLFILILGLLLHFSELNISIFGTPVVFYGMIIVGIALVIDGLF
jgi:hypothetical protein